MNTDSESEKYYNLCVELCAKQRSWATYWTLLEDGFDPKVDWKKFYEEWSGMGTDKQVSELDTLRQQITYWKEQVLTLTERFIQEREHEGKGHSCLDAIKTALLKGPKGVE